MNADDSSSGVGEEENMLKCILFYFTPARDVHDIFYR